MRNTQACLVVICCVVSVHLAQGGGASTDLEKIQGVWKVESFVIEGKKASAKDIAMLTYTFKGDGLTIADEEGKDTLKIKLDPSQKPPAIDMIADETKFTAAGIYRLEGDTLTICWYDFVKDPTSRPKELAPSDRGTIRFVVLKRS